MFKTTAMLYQELKEYRNPADKIARMVKEKELIPLKRGLFVTDKSYPVEFIAVTLNGPSYVSFERALSYYGLIPERVYGCSCAVTGRNKTISYTNEFGTFLFENIPETAFPLGLTWHHYGWLLATPEKALCDLVYKRKRMENIKEMQGFLKEGMRIDMEELADLGVDFHLLEEIAAKYKSQNVNLLVKALRKEIA